ncbi:hypothetical protein GP486_006346 [Trichoglossum hirsutum]|uniref:Uncharacterized protein n=1 Tax=Trichoglossum hirsutum TaxID=265104 RepID=A0A9P8L7G2_9PEZI|nr:hypothetical protein GP486_006346 [Trichoglossum hirsutum]
MDHNVTLPGNNIPPPEGEHRASATSVEKPKSPYDEAREHIIGFRAWLNRPTTVSSEIYQKDFSVNISKRELARLCSELFKEDRSHRFPNYSYDASTSTLVVHNMPSDVHKPIIQIIQYGFLEATRLLPDPGYFSIYVASDKKYKDFGGKYEGSTKTPDVAVLFGEERELGLAVEVGFSETYDRLIGDAKLWLEGREDVKIVLLVDITEAPSYRSPLRNPSDEEIEELELSLQTKISFNTEGDFGPITNRGLVWVGRIAASMEVWRRDPQSGLATRHGDRMDLLPPASLSQLEFKLSDFVTAPLSDIPIRFRWDYFREELRLAMKSLAKERYRDAVSDLGGRTNAGDGPYEPGEPSKGPPQGPLRRPARLNPA